MSHRTRRNRLPRRLLAVGLVAGVAGVGGVGGVELAGAAQAAPTTVDAGHRAPVIAREVSPAALPAGLGAGTTRRTSWVTVTL